MALKKVSFETTKIQKLRRVTLDQNLLETLGLDIGDIVRVELDTENATVLISRARDPMAQADVSTPYLGSPRVKGA